MRLAWDLVSYGVHPTGGLAPTRGLAVCNGDGRGDVCVLGPESGSDETLDSMGLVPIPRHVPARVHVSSLRAPERSRGLVRELRVVSRLSRRDLGGCGYRRESRVRRRGPVMVAGVRWS